MKNFVDTVQKKIGLLIGAVGIGVVILNIIYRFQSMDFVSAISGSSVWSVLLFALIFMASVFWEHRFMKYLQVGIFFLVGILNILDDYNDFYGPGMFFAAWLLMRHYGFLEKRAVLKHAVIIILLILMSQLSAFIHIGAERAAYAGFSTLAFTLFLVFLIIIIWRDMVKQQKHLQKQNQQLHTNYDSLSKQLTELEANHKPFNLKAANITPAEERVIETLTRYRASNREIAERLSIAESTVKLHLYNIYNKIGVDNRFAVIDLCKYNFSE